MQWSWKRMQSCMKSLNRSSKKRSSLSWMKCKSLRGRWHAFSKLIWMSLIIKTNSTMSRSTVDIRRWPRCVNKTSRESKIGLLKTQEMLKKMTLSSRVRQLNLQILTNGTAMSSQPKRKEIVKQKTGSLLSSRISMTVLQHKSATISKIWGSWDSSMSKRPEIGKKSVVGWHKSSSLISIEPLENKKSYESWRILRSSVLLFRLRHRGRLMS